MTDCLEVTDEMIKQHDRLVQKVINREVNLHVTRTVHGLSGEDVFQIGRIGLWKALQRFDDSKNVKFSSYAYKMIHGEIMNSIRYRYYGIRTKDKISKAISRYIKEMNTDDGCNLENLKLKYKLKDEDLTDVIELANKKFVCGDDKATKKKNSDTYFNLYDKNVDDIDKVFSAEEWKEMLEVAPPSQRDVLELYLKDFNCGEISEILGKKQSAVRTLLSLGIRSIKKYYTYENYSA